MISHFEKVNLEKLNKVLESGNIPKKNDNDNHLLKIYNYSKQDYIDGKGFEIKYFQKNNFGRHYSSNGLQLINKDIKNYITSDNEDVPYYQDIDIANCQPTLLYQLLEKNNIVPCTLLKDYCKNRQKSMKKYRLKNKESILFIINSETYNTNNDFLVNFHNQIYKSLFPILKKNNSEVYKRLEKDKRKKGEDNIKGSFISLMLQDIENNIMLSMRNYIINKKPKLTIGVLMFDGLNIEKHPDVNSELLTELEDVVYEETEYEVTLKEKELTTDWKPIKGDIDLFIEFKKEPEEEYSKEYSFDLFQKLHDENGNINENIKKKLMDYLNMYIFMINYPLCFYYRTNTSHDFICVSKIPTEIFGHFPINKFWLLFDSNKKYNRAQFIVDVDDPNFNNPHVYNTYKMPEYTDTTRTLNDIAPKFNSFLMEVMSNDIDTHYNFYIEWITKMINKGRTNIAIALLGLKGIGKSSFVACLVSLITDDPTKYYNLIQDIDNITRFFNASSETCILTSVEEVKGNAGDYHPYQSKLKTLVTEEFLMVNKKGIDTLGVTKTYNNYIFLTNEDNPIKITYDNRRYFATKPNPKYKNNSKYFISIKDEVEKNAKELRGFFRNRTSLADLNAIRPITEAELKLRKLNTQTITEFINEEINAEMEETRDLSELYTKYKYFVRSSGEKNELRKKYFSCKLEEHFKIQRIQQDGIRTDYVLKEGEDKQFLIDNEFL